MSVWAVFLLPPAVALAGTRLMRLMLGPEHQARHGFSLRFAVGLGVGMLICTQALLLGALLGWNTGRWIALTALAWGAVELALLVRYGLNNAGRLRIRFQWPQLWLLFLAPVVFYFWVFGRLSVVEGTMEFDAAIHWLAKAKFLYLRQGHELMDLARTPRLAYLHWDYPLLVPALYTLNYGLAGRVDEFATKVWPFWMNLSLCLAVLSLGNTWRRPHPLPIAAVITLCFLPATLLYCHCEGGTMPMVFYAGLATLLLVQALGKSDLHALAAAIPILAGCSMAKFEGMIFAGLWCCLLLPVCWHRRWLREAVIVRTAGLALVCLVPYATFRLEKPVLHPESAWAAAALQSPGSTLARFPRILEIGMARRFFHPDFASWTETPDGRLNWSGQWQGWRSLTNDHLFVLPWLSLLLLAISLWRRRHPMLLLSLTLVVIGVLVIVCLVLASLPPLFPQGSDAAFILGKTSDDMSRYSYPFFAAWFLGLVSAWFGQETPTPAAASSEGGSLRRQR